MTYLLLIITALVTILQIDNLKAKPFNKKAWFTVLLVIAATMIAYFVQKDEQTNLKNEKTKSDSTANARTDSSNKVILNGIGQAIGKYSLGYDTAKQEIVRLQKLIKDSANRKTTIIQGENPTISFTPDTGVSVDSIKNNILSFTVSITSYSAASILKNAFIYVIVSDSELVHNLHGLRYVRKVSLATKDLHLGKEGYFSQMYGFTTQNLRNLKTIIILLTGSYTDSYGNNLQEINEVGMFDLQSRKFSKMVLPFDDQIRDFLKSKGVL